MKNTRATNDWMIEWMALKMRFLCKVSKKPNFRSLILNNNSLLTSFHAGTSRSFQTGCFITLTWGVRFSFHTGTIFDQKIRYVCVYCAWIIGIEIRDDQIAIDSLSTSCQTGTETDFHFVSCDCFFIVLTSLTHSSFHFIFFSQWPFGGSGWWCSWCSSWCS